MDMSRDEVVELRIGELSREELLCALRDANVQLNTHAETLLAHHDFDQQQAQTVQVVQRTVEALGLTEGGVQSEVFAAAADHGLALCPLVTGPYLRLALLDQPDAPDSVLSAGRAPTGSIHVASAPLSEDVEVPKGFYLRTVDGQSWLRGFRCDDEYVWPPQQQVAFLA